MEKRVTAMQSCAFVGTEESISPKLMKFIERTGADELMIASSIFDHEARVHSYNIFSSIRQRLEGG